MKNRKSSLLALPQIALLATLSCQGSLVMHWKLDEGNGDYTGGGYLEEVSGNTSISLEAPLGISVTEGQAGLAPDGGTSMLFSDTNPDSYITVGSVENTGAYLSGPATTPFVLGANLTMTAWFNPTALASDSIILSNQFGSNTGFMFGTRGTDIIMDFGNTRATYSGGLSIGEDYFMAVRMDLAGDTNFGWAAGSDHRISLYSLSTDTWQHFDGTQFKTGLNLQNLSIGRFTNGGREFNGLIDDVRIYDETLSEAGLAAMVVSVPESGSLLLLGLVPFIGIFRRSRR